MRRLLVAVVLALAPAAAAQSGPWTDLGFALAGSNGLPHLECIGPLTPGSGLEIHLSNAKDGALSYLVLGLTAIYAPYKGGVLVPNFDLLVYGWTYHSGGLDIETHWPAGVPSGVSFYLQYWIDDEAAVAGRSGSNALMAVVP